MKMYQINKQTAQTKKMKYKGCKSNFNNLKYSCKKNKSKNNHLNKTNNYWSYNLNNSKTTSSNHKKSIKNFYNNFMTFLVNKTSLNH